MRFSFVLLLWLLTVPASADSNAGLDSLIADHWAWYLEQFPNEATALGERDANGRWPDMSLEAHIERDRKRAEFLQGLKAIAFDSLSSDNQLNYTMLNKRLESARREHALGLDLMAINMREGPQHLYSIAEYTPFEASADYRMWLSRLRGIPALLAQHQELLEEGVASERVQAQVVMQRVPAQIDKVIVEDIEQSPFYRPFLNLPENIAQPEAGRLQDEARAVIRDEVNPAYREFGRFMRNSYLPAGRSQPGIGSLPDGEDIYRFLAADFTTTAMTPEQIHAVGKAEVARIRAEMQAVKKQVGFAGTLAEFNQFLRTDSQFYYQSAAELMQAYEAVSKRLDPQLVNLFTVLPRMPYGVRAIPAELAPDTTTAYYMPPAANGSRAGYYYVNLHQPEVRPKYEMEVLSVHEAVPGHHLQIALAQEIEGLPMFRKLSSVTAFVEGWALYSERLGYQMGLYQDPYSKYGQLTYDMWRAVRLVVDTGIHYYGWSRQQAIDYFKDNAGKTEADIINEIDRYIGWPGQALAYKVGQLKILELRQQAEQQLGDDFDIRRFHDHLLGAGAIPLDALEQRMNTWVEGQL